VPGNNSQGRNFGQTPIGSTYNVAWLARNEGITMKTYQIKKKLSGFRDDESGATAVIVALLLVVLLGMGALGIDIGHMYAVDNQLKKAAEAGALAGARGLWPQDISSAVSRDPDCATGATWALNTAMSNKVEGVNLAADEVKVEVGRWDYATRTFIPGISTDANGVRVTTYRANIPMFLAKIFGIFSKDLSASATAIMDIIGSMPGQIPVALSKRNANNAKGAQLIIQFGTSSSTNVQIGWQDGGWFTVQPDSCSASVVSSYINGDCPQVSYGQTLNLSNGEFTSGLQNLKTLLDNSTYYYNGQQALDTYVPVVNTDDFTQTDTVQGFVHFLITAITIQGSNKTITGEVLEAGILPNGTPGGGGNFGVLSTPKLVQ
jgi:Flp pilus assembly protein TadG